MRQWNSKQRQRRYLQVAIVVYLLAGRQAWCDDPQPRSPTQTLRIEHRRFEQRRFVIGAFWTNLPDGNTERWIRQIADANFTLVFGPLRNDSSASATQEHIDLCGRHNLDAVVHCPSIPFEKLPTGKACLGYRLFDEPHSDRFDSLAKQVRRLRQAQPGRLAYINLFPNYANRRQLGTATYEEYVASFLEKVEVDVLSMDHYPIFKPSRDTRDRYCQNLDTIRRHALKSGIPFWNYFNAMPFGPHTDPTEAQLRWQIYTSLTYGAKGVLYFNYGSPRTFEFPKGGGLIRRDGSRTRHWFQAQRINAALKHLGPTLMQLHSTGVYRVSPDDDPVPVLKGTAIINITRQDVDPPHDYLVGMFRHTAGRRAVMLHNYRFAFTAWPTVDFDVPIDQIREIDQKTGREIAVIDDSPDMEGLQLSLDAGAARLFLLPAASTANRRE